jgi:2-polyprenyl-6-methoxyphenol hydroxylase-like FAD-dependent oxidoreductase
VADAVIAAGHVAANGEMRRADGRLLRRFELDRVRELLPEPTVTALRPVLHGALLDAMPAGSLMLAHEITDVVPSPSGPAAVLRGGRMMGADVIVGADGVGSVVRKALHPREGAPRSSDLFGLRGVATGVVQHMGNADGAQYFGRGVEGGLARAGRDTVYWYLSVPRSIVERVSRDPVRVRDAATRGFDSRFTAIASATAAADMRLDELVDREPLASWGRNGVTLLGDAAHPMLPHAGQGAAQALEDAVALGVALAGQQSIYPGLRAYETARIARTRGVVHLSRRNARLGSLSNPVACWLRDSATRFVPERVILRQLVAVGRPPAVY